MFPLEPPSSWERVELSSAGRDGPVRSARPGPGTGGGVLGAADRLREALRDRRDLAVLAAAILIVCDCDDSLEMLIALAVLFYPFLSGGAG